MGKCAIKLQWTIGGAVKMWIAEFESIKILNLRWLTVLSGSLETNLISKKNADAVRGKHNERQSTRKIVWMSGTGLKKMCSDSILATCPLCAVTDV